MASCMQCAGHTLLDDAELCRLEARSLPCTSALTNVRILVAWKVGIFACFPVGTTQTFVVCNAQCDTRCDTLAAILCLQETASKRLFKSLITYCVMRCP